MDRSILFIYGIQKNFLISTVIKGMEKADFEVLHSDPDVIEISHIENPPDIFVVYLEGELFKFIDTLKFIKTLIEEKPDDRALFLIGTPSEIAGVNEIISPRFVKSAFIRPVNVQDVVEKIDLLFTDNTKKSSPVKKLLVVDDDPVMLRTMNNWFSKKYRVFMANSGMNAITLLAKEKVDLILLDYEMPVISGLQVFEMLKNDENTSTIPVMFLTANDNRETVMKVIAAKPVKYLLKSMKSEVLIKSVDDFFAGKQQ